MIETVGNKIDEIPVTISYRIIELFSAGLYSSPNKAFEELVSNSYDAYATKVSVYVPSDKTLENSIMWVCDNGNSMNKDELKDFWKIGESSKKNTVEAERMPIGKFGIGKLATYILAQNLTVICKSNEGKYYGTVMNYGNISDSNAEILLDEKELTETETKRILTPIIKEKGSNMTSFELWGDSCEKTWTMVIMSKLKPKANEIKEGRLKWILSTAMPLNPNFNLTYNGKIVESSKSTIAPWNTWVVGAEDDNVVIKKPEEYTTEKIGNDNYLNTPNLSKVKGVAYLYRDSLLSGKAASNGRSHGIFLLVRKRLINIDDPLLGMDALTHGVFNRLRFIIEADGLNDYITSTRESIKSSLPFYDLQTYIKRKFSEIRDWYFRQIEQEEKVNQASYKIANAAASLSRRPLVSVAKKYYSNKIGKPFLTEIPYLKDDEEKQQFLKKLEERLTTEDGIINKVQWESLHPREPIAKLDLANGLARINLMHPFFANFIDEIKSPLPFQLIALTEILTESIMLEDGMKQDQVVAILKKRDDILRELTYSDKPNAPFVAQLLKDSVNDAEGLEDSVNKAFNSLGFESFHIGGKGKPDGLATAIIGPQNDPQNYSITFDSKSTGKEKIMASTAHISGVKRHKEDYDADYCCVIAIDFQGADDPESAVNKEAKTNKVSLIRAIDLAKMVLLSTPKQLGLNDIKRFFETCHTVIETSTWIEQLAQKKVERGPIKELLETAYLLNKEDTEPAHLFALRQKNKLLNECSVDNLRSLVTSIERRVPGFIHLNNDIVSLNVPPHKIIEAINKIATDVPADFSAMYLDAFKSL